MASLEVETSDADIPGIVLICFRDASVLFNPESSHSYISPYFALHLVMPNEALGFLYMYFHQ